MASERLSKIQKPILLVLASAFTKGIKCVESPDLRAAVDCFTKSEIDRSNFQKSLKSLVEKGYVMKEVIVHEVWYNVTPKGFEKAVELASNESGK